MHPSGLHHLPVSTEQVRQVTRDIRDDGERTGAFLSMKMFQAIAPAQPKAMAGDTQPSTIQGVDPAW